MGCRRARDHSGPDARHESRAHRARRAREHRVPDRRPHRRHAPGRRWCVQRVARRRRRRAQRPASAIPGRHPRRARASTRQHGDHRLRRCRAGRARRRDVAIRIGAGLALGSRSPLRAAHERRRSRYAPRSLDRGAGALARLGEVIVSASRKWWLPGLAGLVLLAAIVYPRLQHAAGHYIHGGSESFAAEFSPPPPRGSPAERMELDELLALQRARTPADVQAARADRKTDISRFYSVLGFPEGSTVRLPRLERLAQNVADDVRPYVRVAKDHYRRLRPYAVAPPLEPRIHNVAGCPSYPP